MPNNSSKNDTVADERECCGNRWPPDHRSANNGDVLQLINMIITRAITMGCFRCLNTHEISGKNLTSIIKSYRLSTASKTNVGVYYGRHA